MIRIRDLYKTLGQQKILNGLNLDIREGETYVIIGQSGVGKSVTLKNISGLLKPDSGEIEVLGKNIQKLNASEFYLLRQQVGVLFQSGALINWLNVGDNVALPLREHNRGISSVEVSRIVAEKLAMVELEGIEKKMPSQLSGGMKKRVGLARAIVHNPRIILYDEPTSGLDPVMSNQINKLILSLQSKLGVTSICVTHDMNSAYLIANRIGMLYQGRIIEEGTPDEIRNTQNEIVRQFIEGREQGPLNGM